MFVKLLALLFSNIFVSFSVLVCSRSFNRKCGLRVEISKVPMMEIKAPLRRISFKYQLGRLQGHEQRSSRMYSTDSFKSYGLKQIRGGPLSMIHVGNK
jgi:hypothetical protein